MIYVDISRAEIRGDVGRLRGMLGDGTTPWHKCNSGILPGTRLMPRGFSGNQLALVGIALPAGGGVVLQVLERVSPAL